MLGSRAKDMRQATNSWRLRGGAEEIWVLTGARTSFVQATEGFREGHCNRTGSTVSGARSFPRLISTMCGCTAASLSSLLSYRQCVGRWVSSCSEICYAFWWHDTSQMLQCETKSQSFYPGSSAPAQGTSRQLTHQVAFVVILYYTICYTIP